MSRRIALLAAISSSFLAPRAWAQAQPMPAAPATAAQPAAPAQPATAAPAAAMAPMPPPPPPPLPPPAPSAPHHHDGLFLQGDVALGYMNTSSTASGIDTAIAGWSGAFALAAGLALDDFVMAGQVWIIGSGSPTVTAGGVTSTTTGVSLSLVGYGPSFVFYFQPDNWFVSVTPSITRATVGYNGANYDTNSGLGMRAALGKEGWVSDHFAVGVAAYVYFASNTTPGATSLTWGTLGAGVGMSASFN